MIDELERWSAGLTTAEVQAVFDRGGVPSSPYRTVKEAMADPQITHRSSFTEVHDAGGKFLAINPPFQMTGSTAAAQPFVAALGEHSEELLAEVGYTPAEVAALVRTPPTAARG